MRELDVRDALAAFYRRLPLGAAIVVMTLVGVAVGNYLAYPQFESSEKILLERSGGAEIPFSREQIAFKKAEITQTQCELLRSNPVLEETARRLGLAERPDPTGSLRDRVHAWADSLLDWYRGRKELLKRWVIERALGGTYSPPPSRDAFREAVDALRDRVRAASIPNTDIVAVTVMDREPEMAARIANTIATIYVASDLASQRARARQIYELIDGQVEAARPAYEAAKAEVERFEIEHEARVLAERIRSKVRESSDLEVALSELVESQKDRLLTLRMELARLQQVFDPDHPKVTAARAELAEAERLMGASASQPAAGASPSEYAGTLLRRIAEAKEALAELNRLDGEYARLLDEKEQAAQLYFSLKEKREEALVAEATRASGTRVVETAVASFEPTCPRKWTNLSLGLAGGVALALAVCGLLEFMDRSVKTPRDVTAAVGDAPVLSSIPDWRRLGWLRGGGHRRGIVTGAGSSSAYARAHVALFERVSLALPAGGARGRVLAVCSALRGEGRSLVAANLAACAARFGGGRALLVDADLDRAWLSRRLGGGGRGRGLGEALGGAALEECVRTTDIAGLSLLAAGSAAGAARVSTAGAQVEALLARLRDGFDWILVDSPPLGDSGAGLILSRCADAAILVIRSGATRVEVAREAAARLRGGPARLLGVALNRRRFAIPSFAYRRL